jgi:hypothetical protein
MVKMLATKPKMQNVEALFVVKLTEPRMQNH